MIPTGFGVGLPWQRAENEPAWYYDALDRLRPAWWHNWKYGRLNMDGYIPMLWRCNVDAVNTALPSVQRQPGRLWLLGNEPERADQSDTPPGSFAEGVRRFRHMTEPLGVRFALPGILWDVFDHGRAWLNDYLAAGGPLPDCWHIHLYDYRGQAWTKRLHGALEYLAGLRDLPVIVTECASWSAQTNADVLQAVRQALRAGNIQAAAWFSAYDELWEAPSLLTENGKLTKLGDLFVAKPEQHTTYIPAVHG